jgi:hypothetical protein
MDRRRETARRWRPPCHGAAVTQWRTWEAKEFGAQRPRGGRLAGRGNSFAGQVGGRRRGLQRLERHARAGCDRQCPRRLWSIGLIGGLPSFVGPKRQAVSSCNDRHVSHHKIASAPSIASSKTARSRLRNVSDTRLLVSIRSQRHVRNRLAAAVPGKCVSDLIVLHEVVWLDDAIGPPPRPGSRAEAGASHKRQSIDCAHRERLKRSRQRSSI